MKRTLSNIFIFLGVIGFGVFGYLVWERNSPTRLAFSTPPRIQNPNSGIESVSQDYSKPSVLRIPSIDVNLPIIKSKIVNNYWESTKKGVSYLETSPIPGEQGNSIVWGHNYPNLLKNLTKVKPNDVVFVDFESGATRRFVVHFTQEVGPNQSSILDPSDDKRITLYTCSGFFDSKRFVVTALLEN